MEFNKNDSVLVTPAFTPNAKHEGKVLSVRKNKYVGFKYKVEYDAWGMIIPDWFTANELRHA